MDTQFKLTWMALATGILLWMLGLFWVDAFDPEDSARSQAIVLTAPPSLPFIEASAEVEYLGAKGLERAWISTGDTRLAVGDTIGVLYGPHMQTIRDDRCAKPPRWVGYLVLCIGTIFLLVFLDMVYVWYL
jgi:hypothetical protein